MQHVISFSDEFGPTSDEHYLMVLLSTASGIHTQATAGMLAGVAEGCLAILLMDLYVVGAAAAAAQVGEARVGNVRVRE